MELTVDGRAVFAATGGKEFDPTLPTGVFLHGAGFDRTCWRLQTRWFAHHGRAVLAPDLPGHGRSAGPACDSVDALADWVAALLDAAGVRQAALVGHSLGALIALATAARHPDRVRALALCGVASAMPVHPELVAAAQAGEHKAPELMMFWGLGRPAQIGGMRTPGLWMTGEGLRVLEQAPPGAIAASLIACNGYSGAPEAASGVRCPTLLVLGDGDLMTPAAKARPLAERIPGARTVMLPATGHMMMVERPDETLAALRTIV